MKRGEREGEGEGEVCVCDLIMVLGEKGPQE